MKKLKKDVELLSPFKMQMLQNFPYIEADFDALTNYGLLCKVVDYLNGMIDKQNEVVIKFNELKNFVDGYLEKALQTDVNKKLDEMASDGSLEILIGKYVDDYLERSYQTVALMKQEDLKVGMKVSTAGYYTANDGGKASYIIKEETPTNYFEVLENGKFAELIEDTKNTINVLQVGAIADGNTDNTDLFSSLITYCNEKRKNIYIPAGEYAIINDLPEITNSISIYGDKSGAGAFENKSIIIDKRYSSNYLLSFSRTDSTGGIIDSLNFRNVNNTYKNKCINLNNSQCYEGKISNCNFYQYGISLNLNNTHGLVIDSCSFIKCGSDEPNSDDFSIKILNSVDVSLINLMVDHTRYQLYVKDQSYVYVTNSHFELSNLNIVNGKSPIYCETGIYGQVQFSNCSIIGLSYKHWVNTLGITPAQVPFMIYGTYANFDNCILSCGIGSDPYIASVDKQCKFANLYYGTISNCKIKAPSYLINSFNLTKSKLINSHIQCDLVTEDFSSISRNSRIIYSATNESRGNYLQFLIPTTDPQTYPSVYPVLYYLYSDETLVETNKKNIVFTHRIENADLVEHNTIRIQSNYALTGIYKLKIYSTVQTSLLYDGYIRITNKVIAKASEIYKNFGGGYGITLFSDDNSNDVYIQVNMTQYRTNALIVEIEGLSNHQDVLMYYDKNINQDLTYTNSLTL